MDTCRTHRNRASPHTHFSTVYVFLSSSKTMVAADTLAPEEANSIIYVVKKEYPEAAQIQVDYAAY